MGLKKQLKECREWEVKEVIEGDFEAKATFNTPRGAVVTMRRHPNKYLFALMADPEYVYRYKKLRKMDNATIRGELGELLEQKCMVWLGYVDEDGNPIDEEED